MEFDFSQAFETLQALIDNLIQATPNILFALPVFVTFLPDRLGAALEVPRVLSDPAPDVLVMELSELTAVLRVRWWITPAQRSDALETMDGCFQGSKNGCRRTAPACPIRSCR